MPLSTPIIPGGRQQRDDLDRPHVQAQRHQLLSGSRRGPGCTRYQWPSSIASVTAPRNTAPMSEAQRREPVRATGDRGEPEQRDEAERGRDDIEHDAGRARRGCAPDVADRERDERRERRDRPRRRSRRRGRRRCGRSGSRAATRDHRHHAEDAAQQPAVPDADDLAARGPPEEQQAARRPLQQDRAEIEAHGAGCAQPTIARSRGAALSRSGPSGGGDDDVLEPHPEPAREVDARARC